MVRQLTERHTITIPKDALQQTGAKGGDFFDVTTQGVRIILIPKTLEDPFTDAEWKKLRKLLKQPGTRYMNAKDAKHHLDRLMRRAAS